MGPPSRALQSVACRTWYRCSFWKSFILPWRTAPTCSVSSALRSMPLKKSVSWNRASCRRWWSRCRPRGVCAQRVRARARGRVAGAFRVTRSGGKRRPRGISKRSTGSRPNALSAPPNARPASGKTERLVAGGASPPSSRRRRRHPRHHPALARPSLPPSFVSGPKKKPRDGGDARSSTSSVAGAALPASAKVRRRDASRSARTHAAVSSAVGRFGRQVTSFASASAAAGVPNAPAPRASASARLRRRAVAAAPPPSPGGGRRPAPRARARRGRARARLARPRRARAARPARSRARARPTCVCRVGHAAEPEGGAPGGAVSVRLRRLVVLLGRRRAGTSLSPSLSRAAERRRLLLHEPPGRGRRRAERRARRGDGETLRARRRGGSRRVVNKPAAKRSRFGPVRPRASPRPAGEAPSVEPARGDARRRRGETRDGDETSARVRRGAGGFRARMGRAGGRGSWHRKARIWAPGRDERERASGLRPSRTLAADSSSSMSASPSCAASAIVGGPTASSNERRAPRASAHWRCCGRALFLARARFGRSESETNRAFERPVEPNVGRSSIPSSRHTHSASRSAAKEPSRAMPAATARPRGRPAWSSATSPDSPPRSAKKALARATAPPRGKRPRCVWPRRRSAPRRRPARVTTARR